MKAEWEEEAVHMTCADALEKLLDLLISGRHYETCNPYLRKEIVQALHVYRSVTGEEFELPGQEEKEHVHKWGPLESSRLAGTVHRKCTVPGCKVINAYDDE